MLTFTEKAVALGCLLFIAVILGLFNVVLFVLGLFAIVPLAGKILRM